MRVLLTFGSIYPVSTSYICMQLVSAAAAAAAAAATLTVWSVASSGAECDPTTRDDSRTSAEFLGLAKQHGVKVAKGVVVKTGTNGRGLFAEEGLVEGQLIMRVPIELCVVHTQEEGDNFTDWPFWQSLQLMQACRGDPFWRAYRELCMPSADEAEATIPVARQKRWLVAHKTVPAVAKLLETRERVEELCVLITIAK